MAHSYTPGLTVADRTVVRRRRLLPLPGSVLVKMGDRVRSDQAVARAELPGKVYPINLANQLSIAPDEIKDYLVKKEGDAVQKDEILAENKPLIKWFKTEIRSPVAGTIESLSEVTGQVLLREPPRVLNLLAYIDGTSSRRSLAKASWWKPPAASCRASSASAERFGASCWWRWRHPTNRWDRVI